MCQYATHFDRLPGNLAFLLFVVAGTRVSKKQQATATAAVVGLFAIVKHFLFGLMRFLLRVFCSFLFFRLILSLLFHSIYGYTLFAYIKLLPRQPVLSWWQLKQSNILRKIKHYFILRIHLVPFSPNAKPSSTIFFMRNLFHVYLLGGRFERRKFTQIKKHFLNMIFDCNRLNNFGPIALKNCKCVQTGTHTFRMNFLVDAKPKQSE